MQQKRSIVPELDQKLDGRIDRMVIFVPEQACQRLTDSSMSLRVFELPDNFCWGRGTFGFGGVELPKGRQNFEAEGVRILVLRNLRYAFQSV